MCKQKKRPSILKYQSNIASNPAIGMHRYRMTKPKHLRQLKPSRVLVVGAVWNFIEPIENRRCFACKSDLTETVDLCQRSVVNDVSRNRAQYDAKENNGLYAGS